VPIKHSITNKGAKLEVDDTESRNQIKDLKILASQIKLLNQNLENI
jgi:hypothetical protein